MRHACWLAPQGHPCPWFSLSSSTLPGHPLCLAATAAEAATARQQLGYALPDTTNLGGVVRRTVAGGVQYKTYIASRMSVVSSKRLSGCFPENM